MSVIFDANALPLREPYHCTSHVHTTLLYTDSEHRSQCVVRLSGRRLAGIEAATVLRSRLRSRGRGRSKVSRTEPEGRWRYEVGVFGAGHVFSDRE